MPSPPRPVSSSHQVIPAATESGSVVSTRSRRVTVISSGAAAGQPVGQAEMPAVITLVVDGALGGQHLERGQPHPVQTVHRPAVAAVGGGERLGVGGPGRGPRRRAPPRPRPARPPRRAGGRPPAARPAPRRRPRRTGAGAGRPALTDQGISSQSSSTHPVPSSSQSPAAPIPARTASSSCRVVAGGSAPRPAYGPARSAPRPGYGPARRTAARSGCTPPRACRPARRTGPGPSPRHGRPAARPASPCAFPRRSRR